VKRLVRQLLHPGLFPQNVFLCLRDLRQLLRFSRRVKQGIRRNGEIRFRELYYRQHCKCKHTNSSLRPSSTHPFFFSPFRSLFFWKKITAKNVKNVAPLIFYVFSFLASSSVIIKTLSYHAKTMMSRKGYGVLKLTPRKYRFIGNLVFMRFSVYL
jgi:hypothetical protein